MPDGEGKWRSPWYDTQVRRRSARDVAQNLDMNPVGSGDMVFDGPVLQQMRTDLCRKPDYEGEVNYRVNNSIDPTLGDKVQAAEFIEGYGKKRFKWWGALEPDPVTGAMRPDQEHNYIVACDISLGTGVSNSTVSVLDVNTNTKVGAFVCPNTSPTNFAEQVVAICDWIGGMVKPFLLWESNGAGGVFGRRVAILNYPFIYYRRDEKKLFRPRTKNPGWHSSKDAKADLLFEYREALAMVFKDDRDRAKFINLDEKSIAEAEEYIFFPSGIIGPASSAEDEGGAKATHGDCVIADALANLGRKEQPVAMKELPRETPQNSPAARREEYEGKQRQENDRRWSD